MVVALLNTLVDRVQLSLHAHELQPSNTSSVVFALAALVQLPLVLAACVVADVDVLFRDVAWLCSCAHLLGWIVGVLASSCAHFDVAGELTFAAALWLARARASAAAAAASTPPSSSSSSSSPPLSSSLELVTLLTAVWVIRLGVFLGWRIVARGRDWRFDKLTTAPAYALFAWQCQATWCTLSGACVWSLLSSSRAATAAPLGAAEWACAALALGGVALETLADVQKTQWNAAFAHDAQNTWIDVGVWRLSRHPNYFGENVFWLGNAALCARAGAAAGACALSAAFSPLFLVFTSLFLLEKRMDAKFGARRDYAAYKRAVGVLVPWRRQQ